MSPTILWLFPLGQGPSLNLELYWRQKAPGNPPVSIPRSAGLQYRQPWTAPYMDSGDSESLSLTSF